MTPRFLTNKFYLLLLICFCGKQACSFGKQDSTKWLKQFVKETIKVQKKNVKQGFETKAYLKSTLILDHKPNTILGKSVSKNAKLQDHQLIWLYESLSDLYYTPQDGYKEWLKAIKSYGEYPSWDFKSAEQLQIDFTDRIVKFEALSDKSFISPLARSNYRYYIFSLKNKENGLITINITPKRKHTPTFGGEIVIDTLTKKLKSLNLNLVGSKGIDFIDTLNIKQQFDLDKSCPNSTKFSYRGDILGFEFSGVTEAFFDEYKSITETPSNFDRKEIVKEDSASYHHELLNGNRAIPLTLQERLSYQAQDKKKIKSYEKERIIDSLDKKRAPFAVLPLFFDNLVWKSENSKRALILKPIAPAFFYNTVEGLGINYGLTYFKYTDNGKYWSLTPKLRYGFTNKELNSDVSFSWIYDPLKRGNFNFSAGSTYRDLNPNGSLSSLQNSINTLFFEQNFLKLYRKEYVSLGIGQEIKNNLYFSVGVELSRNFSVENRYDYSFNDIKTKNFTSNNPINPIFQNKLFPEHSGLFINASIIYTINQPFITYNGEKIYKLPLGPRFIFKYRHGIPGMFQSESDYRFIEFEAQQEKWDMGLLGYGSYSISAGKFINANKVYFPEWKHFIGNSSLVFNSGLKSFHLLDFYKFSTDQYFVEGHFEHNFNNLISNKIPFIRALKLEELVGGAYLYQPQQKNYYELYVGLRRLMYRADYALSFNDYGIIESGFRISYNF